jgi:hypothetical protein
MIAHSIGNWSYEWYPDSTVAHTIHRKLDPNKFLEEVPSREWVLLDNKNNYLAVSRTGFFWKTRTSTHWKTYKLNYGTR